MTIKADNRDYGFDTSDGPSKIIIERLTSKKVTDNLRCDINDLLKQLSASCPRYDSNRSLSYILDQNLLVLIVFDIEVQRVVGVASALFRQMLSETSYAIGDVVIDEKYRGKGIGKCLMKNLIEQIKIYNCGASHISLTSNPARRAANKLYQELGFQRRETSVYRLPLK